MTDLVSATPNQPARMILLAFSLTRAPDAGAGQSS